MTATLPQEIQQVFDRFITTEFTTIDAKGAPITWPVTPYYSPGDQCIDVTTGLGYPKKANDAEANSKVALLFSDPTGCALDSPPMVLVQGTAQVDDRDLDANRERYGREAVEKLPATKRMLPPKPLRKAFGWYFTRIYVHVRPERVYLWPDADPSKEPRLFDAHMEEVRSGHDEEPDALHPNPEGGEPVWDDRIDQLGEMYSTAVVSLVAPDGFPFSVRVPVRTDRQARRIHIGGAPVGVPFEPGLACITAHDHHPEFKWQRNFQVRGDLVQEEGHWALVPHKMVGGFELPPTSLIQKYKLNWDKIKRFRRNAKRELERRESRR
jgi:Pyridoxamine 5'-phosphate oxidase